MAGRNPWEALSLVVKPFRDVAVFTGRSTRTETLLFIWLMAALFTSLDRWIAATAWPYALALQWLVFVIASAPQFALMSRRVQDFDVPGWVGASSVALLYAVAWAGGKLPGQPGTDLPIILIFVGIVTVLSSWSFALCPPSPGANRYGLDPRPAPAPTQ
jgi:uncharacterized membrane protein YhaH (DUF805 family)